MFFPLGAVGAVNRTETSIRAGCLLIPSQKLNPCAECKALMDDADSTGSSHSSSQHVLTQIYFTSSELGGCITRDCVHSRSRVSPAATNRGMCFKLIPATKLPKQPPVTSLVFRNLRQPAASLLGNKHVPLKQQALPLARRRNRNAFVKHTKMRRHLAVKCRVLFVLQQQAVISPIQGENRVTISKPSGGAAADWRAV